MKELTALLTALLLLARAERARGRGEEARQAAAEALRLRPGDAEARKLLGQP
jgi:Flp pilus assembly protein TadD